MAPSSAAASPPDGRRGEISGRLTIDGERREGLYGAYRHVTVTPVHATLSEKVRATAALPSPDATMEVRALARQNANGRWNVIRIEAGPRELKGVLTTGIEVKGLRTGTAGNDLSIDQGGSNRGESGFYLFRILPKGAEAFETCVPSRALERFGIQSLPVAHALNADCGPRTEDENRGSGYSSVIYIGAAPECQKSLENQIPFVGSYIKDHGGSAELANMFAKLIDYYAKYQNSYIKHDDNVVEPGILLHRASCPAWVLGKMRSARALFSAAFKPEAREVSVAAEPGGG
jgi:hypothetical protein